MAFHSSSRRPSTRASLNPSQTHPASISFTQTRQFPTLSLAPSPQSKSSDTPSNAIPEEGIVSGGGGGGGAGAGSGEAMGDGGGPDIEDLTNEDGKTDKPSQDEKAKAKESQGEGDKHVEHLGGDASGGIDKEMMRASVDHATKPDSGLKKAKSGGNGKGKGDGMNQEEEKEVIAKKKDSGKKEEPRKWVSYADGKGSGDYGDVSKYHPAWEGFGKGPSVGKRPKAKRESKL